MIRNVIAILFLLVMLVCVGRLVCVMQVFDTGCNYERNNEKDAIHVSTINDPLAYPIK